MGNVQRCLRAISRVLSLYLLCRWKIPGDFSIFLWLKLVKPGDIWIRNVMLSRCIPQVWPHSCGLKSQARAMIHRDGSHRDGSGLVQFINRINSFSDHAHFGRLDVYLVGGLHEDNMYQSWPGNFLANYANKKKKNSLQDVVWGRITWSSRKCKPLTNNLGNCCQH